MNYSSNWKMWYALLDTFTCIKCRRSHGKIYHINQELNIKPPVHPYCRCLIKHLKSLHTGTATDRKCKGADWYLKYYNKFPEYYISYDEAIELGYVPFAGNLSDVASGKMLSKGVFDNIDKHLSDSPERVWYEADINYESGYRGCERILYSNDGLIFVTYDHYQTFCEIV